MNGQRTPAAALLPHTFTRIHDFCRQWSKRYPKTPVAMDPWMVRMLLAATEDEVHKEGEEARARELIALDDARPDPLAVAEVGQP